MHLFALWKHFMASLTYLNYQHHYSWALGPLRKLGLCEHNRCDNLNSLFDNQDGYKVTNGRGAFMVWRRCTKG